LQNQVSSYTGQPT